MSNQNIENIILEQVIQLIDQVDAKRKSSGVDFRGKKYSMVVDRIATFRKSFGWEYGIETRVISELTGENMVAVGCYVKNSEGRIVGSGLAYEHKDNGPVNKTSALENCETSAIGRALASMGLAGGEYASGDEVYGVEDKDHALWRDEFPLGLMSVLTATEVMSDKNFMKFSNDGQQKIWFCKYLGEKEKEHYIDYAEKRKEKLIEQQEKK
ncbi:rad52-like recombinase [uncultured Mediterranean phage uvMED]|nr:rad52-like recombinase [uncultured Mediterranean phage uvMED]|tara:strand:- start:852 stop:1484 length:633 start_codon:yes stop_codon:yes gene_type:complete